MILPFGNLINSFANRNDKTNDDLCKEGVKLDLLSQFTLPETLKLFSLAEDCIEQYLLFSERFDEIENFENEFTGIADVAFTLCQERWKERVKYLVDADDLYRRFAELGLENYEIAEVSARNLVNSAVTPRTGEELDEDDILLSERVPKKFKKISHDDETVPHRSKSQTPSVLKITKTEPLTEDKANSDSVPHKRSVQKLLEKEHVTCPTVDIPKETSRKRKLEEPHDNLVKKKRFYGGKFHRAERSQENKETSKHVRRSLKSAIEYLRRASGSAKKDSHAKSLVKTGAHHIPTSPKKLGSGCSKRPSNFMPEYTIPKKRNALGKDHALILYIDEKEDASCFGQLSVRKLWEKLGHITDSKSSQDSDQIDVMPDNVEPIRGKLYFKADVRYLSTVKVKDYTIPSSEVVSPFLVPIYDVAKRPISANMYWNVIRHNLFANQTYPAHLIASNHMLLETPHRNAWNLDPDNEGRFSKRVLYCPAPPPETVGRPNPRDGALDRYTRESAKFYKDANLLPNFSGGNIVGTNFNKLRQKVDREITNFYGIPLYGYSSTPQDTLPNGNEVDVVMRAFKSAISCHLGRVVDKNPGPFRKESNFRQQSQAATKKDFLWRESEDYAFHVVQQRICQRFRAFTPYYSRIPCMPLAVTEPAKTNQAPQ